MASKEKQCCGECDELYGGECGAIEKAQADLANRRKFVEKAMEPAVKAVKDFAKQYCSDEARTRGERPLKTPKLAKYTEAIHAKDRAELRKLIEDATSKSLKWKVRRSIAEGFRYDILVESPEEEKLLDDVLDPVPAEDIADKEVPDTAEGEPNPVDTLLRLIKVTKCGDNCISISPLNCGEGEECPSINIDVNDSDMELLSPMFAEENVDDTPFDEPKEEVLEEKPEDADGEHGEEETEVVESINESDEDDDEDDDGDDEDLEESSTAEKRAFRKGGKDFDDLVQGKAIARIHDKNARDAAIASVKAKRPDVTKKFIGDRKEAGVVSDIERKNAKMSKAGLKDESLLKEDAKVTDKVEVRLDDLDNFQPVAGAVKVWDLIKENGKVKEFANSLRDFTDGDKITSTDLNDILWLEAGWVLDTLGIRPYAKGNVIDVEAEEK